MRRALMLLLSCVLAVTVMAKTKKTADGTGNLSKARREELSRKVAGCGYSSLSLAKP